MIVILIFGFCSGMPLALVGSTLQLWYTQAGVGLIAIGFLTLVGIPYTYKFLWAPLLDRFSWPFLGRRRGWILVTQVALMLSIALMAMLKAHSAPLALGALALWVAFLSSTQDIAINAYQTDIASPNERGMIASAYIIGYRLSMFVSGAFALVLAENIGWHLTYLLMSLLIGIGPVFVCIAKEPAFNAHRQPHLTFREMAIEPFVEFYHRKGKSIALWLLVAMILYKLPDAFALSLNSVFLFRALHFTLEQIAVASKMVGVTTTIIGVFIGGLWMRKIGLYKSVLYFGILQCLSNLGFLVLALIGKQFIFLLLAVGIENFCGGLGTAAFVGWIMSLCNIKHSATQFALLTALSAIGRVYIGPVAALIVEHFNWAWFFLVSIISGIPGILLIIKLRSYFDEK